MRRNLLTSCWLGVALLGTTSASADPIILLSGPGVPLTTSRSTFVEAHVSGPTGPQQQVFDRDRDTLHSAATLSGGGGAAAGTATLTSSFADPLHWFGAATTSVSLTAPADASASSQFRGGFQVTAPVTYTFTTKMEAQSALVPVEGSSLDNTFALANAFAVLGHVVGSGRDEDEPLGELLFNVTTGNSGPANTAMDRSLSGLLMPGAYFLFTVAQSVANTQLETRATSSQAASFTFTMDFTPAESPSPTPEPTSVLLLGTALAGVVGYRRRLHETRSFVSERQNRIDTAGAMGGD